MFCDGCIVRCNISLLEPNLKCYRLQNVQSRTLAVQQFIPNSGQGALLTAFLQWWSPVACKIQLLPLLAVVPSNCVQAVNRSGRKPVDQVIKMSVYLSCWRLVILSAHDFVIIEKEVTRNAKKFKLSLGVWFLRSGAVITTCKYAVFFLVYLIDPLRGRCSVWLVFLREALKTFRFVEFQALLACPWIVFVSHSRN